MQNKIIVGASVIVAFLAGALVYDGVRCNTIEDDFEYVVCDTRMTDLERKIFDAYLNDKELVFGGEGQVVNLSEIRIAFASTLEKLNDTTEDTEISVRKRVKRLGTREINKANAR